MARILHQFPVGVLNCFIAMVRGKLRELDGRREQDCGAINCEFRLCIGGFVLTLKEYHEKACSIIEGRCYKKVKLRVFAAAESGANNKGKNSFAVLSGRREDVDLAG